MHAIFFVAFEFTIVAMLGGKHEQTTQLEAAHRFWLETCFKSGMRGQKLAHDVAAVEDDCMLECVLDVPHAHVAVLASQRLVEPASDLAS